jgi:hypothetical protein
MARTIQLTDRVVRTPGHLAEEIDGQIVLLSIEAGNYYGLDEIGSEIWRLAEKETPVVELCDIFAVNYDAPMETVQRDVLAFLNHLLQHKLISAR